MYIAFFVLDETNLKSKYSQTCNKTKSKSGLIGQVTSWKRFNPYEIWPFNTGICVLEVMYLCVRGHVFVLEVMYLCVRGHVFVC
jgi:hypothetical protein